MNLSIDSLAHTEAGELVLLSFEGRSNDYGVSLFDIANFLTQLNGGHFDHHLDQMQHLSAADQISQLWQMDPQPAALSTSTAFSLRVRQAINLDGGGSATLYVNGTLRNYPSDQCPSPSPSFLNCERAVTTIVCIRDFEAPAAASAQSTTRVQVITAAITAAIVLSAIGLGAFFLSLARSSRQRSIQFQSVPDSEI